MKADVRPATHGPRNQPLVHNNQPRKASCCLYPKKLKMLYSNQIHKARIWLIIDSLSNLTSISTECQLEKKLHLKLIMDFFSFSEATQDLCICTESWIDTKISCSFPYWKPPHSSACYWQMMVDDSPVVEVPKNMFCLLLLVSNLQIYECKERKLTSQKASKSRTYHKIFWKAAIPWWVSNVTGCKNKPAKSTLWQQSEMSLNQGYLW